MSSTYTAKIKKMEYVDYLPTPFRLMVPLVSKRQLVVDINSSHNYADNFPILEKLENFKIYWENFSDKVAKSSLIRDARSIHKSKLLTNVQSSIATSWFSFANAIDSLDFVANTITTVPRYVIRMWPIDFSFIELDEEDKKLLRYFDLILVPPTTNLWEDFLRKTEDILDTNIHPYISDLTEIREITNYKSKNGTFQTDTEVLNLTAKMLGLNMREDLLKALNFDRLAAVVPLLGQFHTINSTDDFIKIIEIVIGSRVLLTHLYSNDYINFNEYNEHTEAKLLALDKLGTDSLFKTTHVNLFVQYNNEVRAIADIIKIPIGSSILDIVKLYLPINLVLKNFGLYIELDTLESAPTFSFLGTIGEIHGTICIK